MNYARQIVEEESARDWLRRHAGAPQQLEQAGWRRHKTSTEGFSLGVWVRDFSPGMVHLWLRLEGSGIYLLTVEDMDLTGLRLWQRIKIEEALPVLLAWTKKQAIVKDKVVANADVKNMPGYGEYKRNFVAMLDQLKAKEEI